ncbi:hypothetical protein Tco_0584854, partial [Tanacetum coccineum]
LGRQSSIGLSQDLRKRTVDELWPDIQQGHKKIKMLSKLQAALKDIEATRAYERLALGEGSTNKGLGEGS